MILKTPARGLLLLIVGLLSSEKKVDYLTMGLSMSCKYANQVWFKLGLNQIRVTNLLISISSGLGIAPCTEQRMMDPKKASIERKTISNFP